MRKTITGLFLFVLALEVGAVPLNTELVTNGGAETGGTSGWSVPSGSTPLKSVDATGDHDGFGLKTFTGGTGSDPFQLSQIIDVSGNAASIDAGTLESIFSIQLQSRSAGTGAATVSDHASVDLLFQDGGGSTLDTFSATDTVNLPGFDWNLFTDTRTLVTGTRQIEVLLTATRGGGSSTDAFFDEVSLELNGLTPVPLPGAALLFLTGCGLLIGARGRRGLR